VKLSRLIQPRNPQFWLLVVLNALSSAIAFILRSHELPAALTVVLAGFALANAVVGLRIAWRLLADEPTVVK
jgi:4-hydroxybenzoate polyprenyltransferase